MKYKIIFVLVATLLLSGVVKGDENTTIDVMVISENDVTGYINGTSVNGSVNYYIDGIEVKGEFNNVWQSISNARNLANKAHGFAGMAYSCANDAYSLAKNTNNSLVSLSFVVENNTHKIYMVRDELVAFEHNYLVFKNDTNNKIENINYRVTWNEDEIDILQERHEKLREDHEELSLFSHLLLLPIFLFIFCFVVIIWIFHKQKKYIDKKIDEVKK